MNNAEDADLSSIFSIVKNIHEIVSDKDEKIHELSKIEDHPFQNEFLSLDSITSDLKSQTNILQAYLTQIIEEQLFSSIQKSATQANILKIGLSLLRNTQIYRPSQGKSIIQYIESDYWNQILDHIINSTRLSITIENLTNYFKEIQDKKIEDEFTKFPLEIDDIIKEKYRLQYYSSPISFKDFLEDSKTPDYDKVATEDESVEDPRSASKLRDDFEKALERKKIQELKQKQSQEFDDYEKYFEMSERDLDQIKRKNSSKRKFSKQSRRRKYN